MSGILCSYLPTFQIYELEKSLPRWVEDISPSCFRKFSHLLLHSFLDFPNLLTCFQCFPPILQQISDLFHHSTPDFPTFFLNFHHELWISLGFSPRFWDLPRPRATTQPFLRPRDHRPVGFVRLHAAGVRQERGRLGYSGLIMGIYSGITDVWDYVRYDMRYEILIYLSSSFGHQWMETLLIRLFLTIIYIYRDD